MTERRRYLTVLFFLLLTGMVSVYLQSRTTAGGPVLPKLVPDRIESWEGQPFITVMPSDLRPGDYILREYRRRGEPSIKLMIVFSPTENYHPPALCYRGIGLKMFHLPSIASASGRIKLAGLGGYQGNDYLAVYHGFYISGRIMPDGMAKKIYEVREKIAKGRVEQYFLEVAARAEKGEEGLLRERLVSFLSLLEPYLLEVP